MVCKKAVNIIVVPPLQHRVPFLVSVNQIFGTYKSPTLSSFVSTRRDVNYTTLPILSTLWRIYLCNIKTTFSKKIVREYQKPGVMASEEERLFTLEANF